ncbi:MAG: type II toxin-antitoxin system RelE/ParE family toxin [Planctomycetota bacterium]
MKRLLISAAACRDRDAIDDYTAEQFGVDQSQRLRDAFEIALKNLQRVPGAGRARPEMSPVGRQFRSVVVLGAFLIVYEVVDDMVRIARILHAARDLPSELVLDDGSE